jgi:hypothetical protein
MVKHLFYIPPMLVVWRRTAGQTGAFVTGNKMENQIVVISPREH